MHEGQRAVGAGLLADPVVMRFYPAPRTRAEAAAWIAGNRRRYAQDGHGLWIIETHDDGGPGFVGDCGLTWQEVNGEPRLEVGYHVRADLWGRGYATEAMTAILAWFDAAFGGRTVCMIVPGNMASERIAAKLGYEPIGVATYKDAEVMRYARQAV